MAEKSRQSPLFAESPLGIVILDRQGSVNDVNAAGCKEFARQKVRLVGRPFLEWVLPSDRLRSRDALERVFGGETTGWKARIRRGDGLARLQEFKASPLRREEAVEGALVFLRGPFENCQGRPETPQLQVLLENLPDQFLVVMDKRGIVRYSSGLSRTHFRSGASVLGTPFRELLGKERAGEETLDTLLKEVGRGSNWAGLQWHRRKDGLSFPVEVFASPFLDPKTGHVLGVLAVGRDRSALREWREKAQEVRPLAQIGSMTARISQEMSQCLDRMDEALARNGDGSGPHQGHAGISFEVARLRRFLGGISEFADRGVLRKESLSLPDLAHRALERVAGRMDELGVQPTVEVPPNLPAVFGDSGYLARTLDLLLENALEALQDTPAGLLSLELKNGPDGVILRMTNSGANVSVERLADIFAPFHSTKEGHSGLGLAVAEGMVKAQNGRIWAEAPEDGALTLTLELPREDRDKTRRFRPVPLNLTRARSILVVDDDESVRDTLRSFLEKVGYDVKDAWSGRSALAALTSGRLPDIVLTDLRMNDGSGYWFLEELARDFPGLVGKTVIITGDSDHEAATELAESTGCPLVRKPFELPELLEILDEVLLRE